MRVFRILLNEAITLPEWASLSKKIFYRARKEVKPKKLLVLRDIDPRLRRSTAKFAIAGAILGAVLLLGERPVRALFAGWTSLREEMILLVLAAVGAIIYGIAIRVLFRREWRDLMSGRRGSEPSA